MIISCVKRTKQKGCIPSNAVHVCLECCLQALKSHTIEFVLTVKFTEFTVICVFEKSFSALKLTIYKVVLMLSVTLYLLQIDVGLHYLLQCVMRKRGVVVQEVGKSLVVS